MTNTVCPKCEGMGREVYTLAGGGRSTQTCTACGGEGRVPAKTGQ